MSEENEQIEPYKGSLDFFEDMADILDAMGVVYVLSIGILDQDVSRTWTNVSEYGRDTVEEFRESLNLVMDDEAKETEETGE